MPSELKNMEWDHRCKSEKRLRRKKGDRLWREERANGGSHRDNTSSLSSKHPNTCSLIIQAFYPSELLLSLEWLLPVTVEEDATPVLCVNQSI